MNILLVKPYNVSDHIQPSLGLGYLATAVRDRHNVEILDCIKENISPAEFREYISKFKPDIAGFQCYTFDLYNLTEMLTAAKLAGAVTVLGGPHPSAAPGNTMEFFGENVDYAFQGESEIGFSKLVDNLAGLKKTNPEDIEGLVWRQEGKVVLNKMSFEDDIDKLGPIAWDLIKPETYPEAQHGAFFRKFPIAPIMITRGCPYSCTFCAGNLISGKKIRKRGVEDVLNEIKTLYRDRGIREFHVIDDNFTMDKVFAKELLFRLKKEALDISWAVPNGIRMDTLDDEMLELMKETGLYLISLGIESGSDRILKLMKKGITVEKVKRAVSLIRRHGIDIAGFFILGFPGETVEDIKKTIRFSRQLPLIRANFFTYLPFPGTESFNELEAQGKLNNVDLKRFYFMNATFTPDGISAATLKSLQRKAFLGFFLRPGILIKNIMQIKSVRHFKFLCGRFSRWMFLK